MRPRATVVATAAVALLVANLLAAAAGQAPTPPPPPPPATRAPAQLAHEAAVMAELRLLLRTKDPDWWPPWEDWADEHAHHCSWDGVKCDADGLMSSLYIPTTLKREYRGRPAGATPRSAGSSGAASSGVPWPRQLVRLSQLRRLAALHIQWQGMPLDAALPGEWLQPGAWRDLQTLWLTAPVRSDAPLPDFPPGAFPALRKLQLVLPNTHATLPASWGASPAVLPALQSLNLDLHVQGGLPPEWAVGMGQLQNLDIVRTGYVGPWVLTPDGSSYTGGRFVANSTTRGPAAQGLAAAQPGLPFEWAGAFPQLRLLSLVRLGLSGTFPREWLWPGRWPRLKHLILSENALSGTLPVDIFDHLPRLVALDLSDNLFMGTVPARWAHGLGVSAMQPRQGYGQISLSGNPSLCGPAFPPAWVATAMPGLKNYELANCPALTGSLPPDLPWEALEVLWLQGTGVTGTIPASWCTASNVPLLRDLYVGNTSIERALPACAGSSHLFNLRVSSGPRANMPKDGVRGAAGVPPRWQAAVLPSVLVLAAILVAAAWGVRGTAACGLGRLGRRRGSTLVAPRLPRSRQQQQQPEQAPLMAELSSSYRSDSNHYLQRRRQRIKQQLGSRRGPLEMMSAESLPDCLTHHLDTAQHAQHDATQHAQHDATPGDAQQRSAALHSAARHSGAETEDVALGLPPAAPVARRPHHAGARLVSTSWKLPTDSLRVPKDALEFVVDKDGEFVVLGSGSNSMVLLARLCASGREVAVKVLELGGGADSSRLWEEVLLMQEHRHPRVLAPIGVVFQDQLLMIVTEVQRHGSLRTVLGDPESRAELRWGAQGSQIAVDVAEGLAFLHARKVLHSDCKPDNVLLSASWRASLADLGLSQVLPSAGGRAAGFTQLYAAPEQLMALPCTPAADMYSFGLLLVSLMTQTVMMERGMWRLPDAPDECPQEVVDLIQECLAPNPHNRPTSAAVLARLRAASSPASDEA